MFRIVWNVDIYLHANAFEWEEKKKLIRSIQHWSIKSLDQEISYSIPTRLFFQFLRNWRPSFVAHILEHIHISADTLPIAVLRVMNTESSCLEFILQVWTKITKIDFVRECCGKFCIFQTNRNEHTRNGASSAYYMCTTPAHTHTHNPYVHFFFFFEKVLSTGFISVTVYRRQQSIVMWRDVEQRTSKRKKNWMQLFSA